MNIEKAMKLKKSDDLYRACQEAETRNCEQEVIRKLYKLYYEAVEREQKRGYRRGQGNANHNCK